MTGQLGLELWTLVKGADFKHEKEIIYQWKQKHLGIRFLSDYHSGTFCSFILKRKIGAHINKRHYNLGRKSLQIRHSIYCKAPFSISLHICFLIHLIVRFLYGFLLLYDTHQVCQKLLWSWKNIFIREEINYNPATYFWFAEHIKSWLWPEMSRRERKMCMWPTFFQG